MGVFLSNCAKKNKQKSAVSVFLKKHEIILTFMLDMNIF